jgi:ABC-type multidrug transport system fused ATPase/permease subunit
MSTTLIGQLPASTWRALAAIWVFGACSAALDLVVPIQIGNLTTLFADDRAVTWPAVRDAVIYVAASQAVLSVVSYWRRRHEVALREHLTRSLTLDLYSRLLRFSPQFFRENEIAKINTRALDDTSTVCEMWTRLLIGIPLAIIALIVFGVVLVRANWFLGVIVILVSLLSAYFLVFDRRIQEVNKRARDTWDDIQAQAQELVGSVGELRTNYAFDYGIRGLSGAFQQWRQMMFEAGRLEALFRAMEPLVAAVQLTALYGIGGALCVGGGLAFGGSLTWGEVIKVALLAPLFQRPVNGLAALVLNWRMAGESTRRLEEYLNTPRVFETRPDARAVDGDAEIALRDVTVEVPSGARILDKVTTSIKPGEHVALCGPAGSGKSTVLRLLSREMSPSIGRVAIGNVNLGEAEIASVARHIGFVPQKVVMLNTSIRNNLLLGLRRPSTRTLDDDGPVDVSTLANVGDNAALDDELLAIVRRVGLEPDVLRKALDRTLAEFLSLAGDDAPLTRQIQETKNALRNRLAGSGDVVIPFERTALFPGSIGENLFGPGRCAGTQIQECASRLKRQITDASLLDTLLTLGRASTDGQPTTLHDALLADSDLDRSEAVADHQAAGLLTQRLIDMRVRLAAAAPDDVVWTRIERRELIPDLSLRDNLLGGRPNPRVLRAAEQAELAIEEAARSGGLLRPLLLFGVETRVGPAGTLLSEGQKQKIALGRALLKRPVILMLDEATASLDEASQSRIVDLLRREYRDRMVLSISHRLSTVRDYDRITVFDRGRLVEEGSFAQLVAGSGVFRELVEHEGGYAPPTRKHRPPGAIPPTAGDVDRTPSGLQRQLAACAIFAHMNSDQLAALERRVRVVRCAAGEVIFSRNEPGRELLVVLDGEVEFFRQPGGASEIVTVYGRGQAFGEVALFTSGTRTLSARARTEAWLGVITRDDLMSLVHSDPAVAVGLLHGLAQRLADVTAPPHGSDQTTGW